MTNREQEIEKAVDRAVRSGWVLFENILYNSSLASSARSVTLTYIPKSSAKDIFTKSIVVSTAIWDRLNPTNTGKYLAILEVVTKSKPSLHSSALQRTKEYLAALDTSEHRNFMDSYFLTMEKLDNTDQEQGKAKQTKQQKLAILFA